ncbi:MULTISPECIES: transcription antitermination factor NusB [Actinomyces]|uniref:Transcription antitermination protein NusB n=1 Tax=Actinomyces respiraculi TaxID=2744574 RepID=A0A7T0PWH7_9ACTO|nr:MULTISPECIES: transcription antitermination factor NusB [Actinomyces]QPL06441.1 transcription antitermination factor NusB [Actinomyces respiraculi]
MTETSSRAEVPERPVKHPVTARTKARRRAIEILFEADQRGMLGRGRQRDADDERRWNEPRWDERDEAPAAESLSDAEVANALRDFAARRAVESANHTEAPAYTREILAGVADHLADVDDTIETYAQGWTLARMPAVDRAIARVATWEIVYNDDVDAPVAVDEAMTLARMLSTDDSPRYLGGVLGRIGDLADMLR